MVALIIIFPNIVSYGDETHKANQQMERNGTAPPPVDLDSLMKQSGQEAGDQDTGAAELLRRLQGESK